MKREQKRIALKLQREKLIKELDVVYKHAFNELSSLDIEEGSLAKLSQAFLVSREAAISSLQKEIEKPIITKSPENEEIH